MFMLTTPKLKWVLLLLATYFSIQAVQAQAGIVAGQTSGMRVVRPNNLMFNCTDSNSSSGPCQELDVDGDGVNDFNLIYRFTGSGYSKIIESLSPAICQVVTDRFIGGVKPLAYAAPIGASPLGGTWQSNGFLCISGAYSGRTFISGNWSTLDTLTRYIGIRQLKNGQWQYGYLSTRRMETIGTMSVYEPIYITSYAMQSVITNTAQQQLVGVELYPNPAHSNIQIKSPHAAWLRIYNALGSLQHEEQLAAGATQVSVVNWASGIYLLRLENASGVYISRFQKTE